jgi:hypothetical protein
MTEQEIKDLIIKYKIGKIRIRGDSYDITNYQIRDDGSIDVDGNVNLQLEHLKQLPLTFNKVSGDFKCDGDNLTTLKGCPKEVGNFSCTGNKVTTLEHSPKIIGYNFAFSNRYITSLEGLEDTYITIELNVRNCSNLYSLKGFPKKVSMFNCENTPIYPIYKKFIKTIDCEKYEKITRFNEHEVVYTDGSDWYIDYDNLGKFLKSMGAERLILSKKNFYLFIIGTKYIWDYKQYEYAIPERDDFCYEYGIKNYQVIDGGSIDVDGDVSLSFKLGYLKQLPLTFSEVKGKFNCAANNLTTLEGVPKEVRGTFGCSDNKLTSLEYSPKIVEESFFCNYNRYITSLEGLENTYISGELCVHGCENLYSLKGFPKKVGSFDCTHTPIKPIYDKFIQQYNYERMRRFNLFDIIYTDGLDWFIDYDNLSKFLRSMGKKMSMGKFDDFIKTTKYRWDY